jgi:hypothetical protein
MVISDRRHCRRFNGSSVQTQVARLIGNLVGEEGTRETDKGKRVKPSSSQPVTKQSINRAVKYPVA